MACSCWTGLMSCVRCEPENTASLRCRLREAEKEAASDGEAIGALAERVAGLERGLAAAVLERDAAVARRRGAERRAEEAEAALEATAAAGERGAEEVREKREQSAGRDARIGELEREIHAAPARTSSVRA